MPWSCHLYKCGHLQCTDIVISEKKNKTNKTRYLKCIFPFVSRINAFIWLTKTPNTQQHTLVAKV